MESSVKVPQNIKNKVTVQACFWTCIKKKSACQRDTGTSTFVAAILTPAKTWNHLLDNRRQWRGASVSERVQQT